VGFCVTECVTECVTDCLNDCVIECVNDCVPVIFACFDFLIACLFECL